MTKYIAIIAVALALGACTSGITLRPGTPGATGKGITFKPGAPQIPEQLGDGRGVQTEGWSDFKP